MKAIIVGHGPSLYMTAEGKDIDSYDVVIRLKRSADLLSHPEIFGSRTDIVCASLPLYESIKKHWEGRVDTYWLFVDTRTFHVEQQELARVKGHFYPDKCIIDKGLCLRWVRHYRKKRNGALMDPRQEKKMSGNIDLSDDQGHLHFSAGMFAIIYAMEYLKPDKLDLIGFDNIYSGSFDWSITRGEDWHQYPDHNWEAEHHMLSDVAEEFGYNLQKQEGTICCSNL